MKALERAKELVYVGHVEAHAVIADEEHGPVGGLSPSELDPGDRP